MLVSLDNYLTPAWIGWGYAAPPPAPDPEAGLVLTSAVPSAIELPSAALERSKPVVLAADFTGLDGTGGGMIAYFGAEYTGAYCGFQADGSFVLRCGKGDTLYPNYGPSTAWCVAPPGVVAGDGTLVAEFIPGPGLSARAWWNGVSLDQYSDASGNWNAWTGSSPGFFLGANGSGPAGEVSGNVVPHTSASLLRHYANQQVLI